MCCTPIILQKNDIHKTYWYVSLVWDDMHLGDKQVFVQNFLGNLMMLGPNIILLFLPL